MIYEDHLINVDTDKIIKCCRKQIIQVVNEFIHDLSVQYIPLIAYMRTVKKSFTKFISLGYHNYKNLPFYSYLT